MAYVRYTIVSAGNFFTYHRCYGEPKELAEQMKYIDRCLYDNRDIIENAWFNFVAWLINNPGCSYARMKVCSPNFREITDKCKKDFIIRTGKPGNYKYYPNQLAVSMYNKYKNTKPDMEHLEKARAKALNEFNEAIEEEKKYRLLVHNYKVNELLDDTLE